MSRTSRTSSTNRTSNMSNISSKRRINAQPFAFEFDIASSALVIIDMQRDFVEPGGFGATLGNDVRPVAAIVPTVRKLLDGARAAKLPIIHTPSSCSPKASSRLMVSGFSPP